jgi:curved DNA-binding protein CbpA
LASFTTKKDKLIQQRKTSSKLRHATHYSVLGVRPGSSDVEIREQYLALAIEYHPDKRPRDIEFFKDVTRAYAVLKNKERRHSYDLALKLMGHQCGACEGTGETRLSRGFHGVVVSDCSYCEGTGQDEA